MKYVPHQEYVNAPYMWQDWTTLATGAIMVFFFDFDKCIDCYTVI